MQRKKLSLLLALVMLATFLPLPAQAQQPVKLWINGSYVKTDADPFIENDRTLVPLRVISENLGYRVTWNGKARAVGIYSDHSSMIFFIGSNKTTRAIPEWIDKIVKAVHSGETPENAIETYGSERLIWTLEASPKIVNDRTFVPIRVIADIMGQNIDWDNTNRTVVIGKGYVAPKPKKSTTKPIMKNKVTREYKAALRNAKNYLDFMPFSKQGLYDQLTSQYGERFPEDAAQYAMENLANVNWKENALKSAKNYREIMHMSNQAIFDQLCSEYGDKFTPEEAQYAVDNLPK